MDKIRGFEVCPGFADKIEAISNAMEIRVEDFMPHRATSGSSGYDLRSIDDVEILPGEVKLVGTGLTAYMQKDEELQLRSRSSFAKRRITLANCPGTVDSDYYGNHIMFLIFNQSDEPFHISEGERIGQGIFSKYLIVDNDCPTSESRDGGFGSTGTK